MVEFDGHSSAAKICVIGKADDSIVGEGTVCPTRDGNKGHMFEIKIAANCCHMYEFIQNFLLTLMKQLWKSS